MSQLTLAFILAGLCVVRPALAPADQPVAVVVELFTSQGCSSCPPADAVLRRLTQRPSVLTLSQHVDYWDYLGWKDPLASPHATERQRGYIRTLGLRYVYTPQMVINGVVHLPGTELSAVETLIAAQPPTLPIAVQFRRDDADVLSLVIPADTNQASEANVWLILIDRQVTTTVGRGENGGRTLTSVNVVRKLSLVDVWTGSEMTLPVDCPPSDDQLCAAMVQRNSDGRILGAARWPAADG